jgi:Na+/H+ antiporter NhaC
VRRTSIFELLTILALCILVGFALANNWGGGIVSGELPSDIDIFPAVPYE